MATKLCNPLNPHSEQTVARFWSFRMFYPVFLSSPLYRIQLQGDIEQQSMS